MANDEAMGERVEKMLRDRDARQACRMAALNIRDAVKHLDRAASYASTAGEVEAANTIKVSIVNLEVVGDGLK